MRKAICIMAALALTATVVAGPRVGKGRDKAPNAPERAGVAVMQTQAVRTLAQAKAVESSPVRYLNERAVGGAAATRAYVFKNDYISGYGMIENLNPQTGAYYPGSMFSDEAILGNGFVPGTTPVTEYETVIFRSSSDPQVALPALVSVALWDGDPFGAIDTSFIPSPLAVCDFTLPPGGGMWMLNSSYADNAGTGTCVLPVYPPHDMVWVTIDGDDCCRFFWILSFYTPEIGAIFMGTNDLAANQCDTDGQTVGGTCCVDDTTACTYPGTPCVDDTAGDRPYYCSDGDAEDAGYFFLGGPCAGLPSDSCASFAVNIYSETDTWVGVLPVGSSSTKSLDFNTIVLDDCSETQVEFEMKIEGFDPDTNDDPQLKTWEVDIFAYGYYFDIKGEMTPEKVPCTTKAECIAAWGGVCTVTGGACAVDGDCPLPAPIEVCGGSSCDWPTGVGGFCAPGFQFVGRGDGLLLKELPAVDVSTDDFRYGSTLSPTGVAISDDGKLWYGGTLRLITTDDVAGTASVITSPASFLKDASNNPIPLVGLVDAYVVCETGQCCDLSITDDPGTPDINEPCLSDTVCKEQCEDLVGGPYYWNPDNTCDDPCIQCLTPNGTVDPDCADGDACTTDTCVDYFCVHTAKTIGPDDCCDGAPVDVNADINGLGAVAGNVDGDQCTDDLCDAPGTCVLGAQCGVPTNPFSVADTPCDDENQCTYDDVCDGAGACAGLDVNVVPCLTPDDCLAETGTAFDCVGGFCLCVLEPPLQLIKIDPPVDNCYDEGDKVEIAVWVGAAANVINGAQMTIVWDPTCFAFESISPGDGVNVFTFEVAEILGVYGAGSVFYAVGVDPFGGVGVNGNAVLATLTLTKLGECNTCNVCFGGENPYDTFLVDDDGYYVGVIPECSKDILDKDEVWIDCPDDVTTNAGCDMRTAEVYWDAPDAGGDCYPVNLVCWGEYPDGSAIPSNKVMGGGEFPLGMSSFWCEAYSKVCDTMAECSWTVTVMEQTSLDVVVQLSPIIAADDICRCIEFELYANCV